MLGQTVLTLRIGSAATKPLQAVRNTWILRRVFAPEPTPPGKVQRNPEELPNLMKLETVDYETLKPAGPLKVILLQDIEGVGHQFDVVNVDRRLARSDLLLTRKAVYASPFDLEYYAKVKEKMADELSKRVRIPYEYICIGRDLQALVVPIKGVGMLDDAIFLGDEPISGPNFEIEARLIRFYVVVSKQYIVPMLGRITHISADESKQILVPESNRTPTAAQLARFGIKEEQPHYSTTPEIDEHFPVVDFMRRKLR
ncbi:hypothetical protein RB195_007076 [Necator americanus]|uniref:Large ribosomal subunit protein bL9m n=1 Tax=Necator americanus TaxID=51031 RepID=A0ABR1BYD4_NECAM